VNYTLARSRLTHKQIHPNFDRCHRHHLWLLRHGSWLLRNPAGQPTHRWIMDRGDWSRPQDVGAWQRNRLHLHPQLPLHRDCGHDPRPGNHHLVAGIRPQETWRAGSDVFVRDAARHRRRGGADPVPALDLAGSCKYKQSVRLVVQGSTRSSACESQQLLVMESTGVLRDHDHRPDSGNHRLHPLCERCPDRVNRDAGLPGVCVDLAPAHLHIRFCQGYRVESDGKDCSYPIDKHSVPS